MLEEFLETLLYPVQWNILHPLLLLVWRHGEADGSQVGMGIPPESAYKDGAKLRKSWEIWQNNALKLVIMPPHLSTFLGRISTILGRLSTA